MTLDRFRNLFPQRKAIIGMLHMAGGHKVACTLKELSDYERMGVSGVIVENYHASVQEVIEVLDAITHYKPSIPIGINILPNEFPKAFKLAKEYDAKFIQMDYVAGRYDKGAVPMNLYTQFRDDKAYQDIVVLGGVWPKYYEPLPNSNMNEDISKGMQRADALVITGEGTGKETPLEKIKTFRQVVGTNYPLVVGAGITPENVNEQLSIADGAIVGSYFKTDGNTLKRVDRTLMEDVMEALDR